MSFAPSQNVIVWSLRHVCGTAVLTASLARYWAWLNTLRGELGQNPLRAQVIDSHDVFQIVRSGTPL
jgi:hypothetical protein